MKILVKTNFEKPGSAQAIKRTVKKLIELGFIPMLDKTGAKAAALDGCHIGEFHENLPECDMILTIGGDGTILHTVSETRGCRKPVLGINTGTIGFLTQLEVDELDKLSILRDGSYKTTNRMMLEVTVADDGKEEVLFALNDAVLHRGASDRLTEILVSRTGGPVVTHRADGVIFSTPTGSTAYSLSAGGAISHPGLELILMTAICPHSHFRNSLILSPDDVYKATEAPGGNKEGLVVIVDGIRAGVINNGGYLTIKKSADSIPFIDLGVRDFYSCVGQKLSFRR